MFIQEVRELKIYPGTSSKTLGKIVKVLREQPPIIEGDPWTFTVLTEQDDSV